MSKIYSVYCNCKQYEQDYFDFKDAKLYFEKIIESNHKAVIDLIDDKDIENILKSSLNDCQ